MSETTQDREALLDSDAWKLAAGYAMTLGHAAECPAHPDGDGKCICGHDWIVGRGLRAPERPTPTLDDRHHQVIRTARLLVAQSADAAARLSAFDLDPIGGRKAPASLRTLAALLEIVDALLRAPAAARASATPPDSEMVYAKKLNGAQRALLLEYVGRCGFEPMGQDDLDAGRISFAELWSMNVQWIRNVADDISALHTHGTGA